MIGKGILVVCFLCGCWGANAQQAKEAWHWNAPNEKHSFELYLNQNDTNTITGHHCAVFYDGRKIDCVESGSVNLTLVSPNVYEGTIKSGYSLQQGNIRVVFNPEENTLAFELLQEPEGEFYIPDDIIMEK